MWRNLEKHEKTILKMDKIYPILTACSWGLSMGAAGGHDIPGGEDQFVVGNRIEHLHGRRILFRSALCFPKWTWTKREHGQKRNTNKRGTRTKGEHGQKGTGPRGTRGNREHVHFVVVCNCLPVPLIYLGCLGSRLPSRFHLPSWMT